MLKQQRFYFYSILSYPLSAAYVHLQSQRVKFRFAVRTEGLGTEKKWGLWKKVAESAVDPAHSH